MASFTKLNGFIEHLAKGYHGNLSTATLQVALSNTAPGSEASPPSGATANCILANVTQISYANLSSRTFTTTSCVQTGGVLNLVLVDLLLTASGAVPTWRYAYLVNTSSTTVANALIGYWDYGVGGVTLQGAGDNVLVDLDNTNGAISLT